MGPDKGRALLAHDAGTPSDVSPSYHRQRFEGAIANAIAVGIAVNMM